METVQSCLSPVLVYFFANIKLTIATAVLSGYISIANKGDAWIQL